MFNIIEKLRLIPTRLLGRLKYLIAEDERELLSDKTLGKIVLFYLLTLFVVLSAVSWDMGIHSDDYWNIFEVHTRSTWDYFDFFLNHLNTRYTAVGVNTFFVRVFYEDGDPFNFVFIRAMKIFGFAAHLGGCWLLYRCFQHMRFPRITSLIVLPLITIPIYGWEGTLWNSAIPGYVVGFLCFTAALYAYCKRRPIVFAIFTFLSLGATEYVIVPSFIILLFFVYAKWRECKGRKILARLGTTAVTTVLAALPFGVWAVINLQAEAMEIRTNAINRNKEPLIFTDPEKWITGFFDRYSMGMQPFEWVRESWYIVPIIIVVGIVLARGWKQRIITATATMFYFASLLPMAAVGYGFLPTQLEGIILRTSRLYYLPGIFFCTACAIAISLIVARLQVVAKYRIGKIVAVAAFGIYIAAVSGVYIRDVKVLARSSEQAYGCIQGFVENVFTDTKGIPPKSVSICGMPALVGHYPIFRGPHSGPNALALKYGTDKRIPLRRAWKCPARTKMNFSHPKCKYPAHYSIQK